jgi:hypothetical protein
VFIITIHHAKDLSAQDFNGLSDPYIVLAYAKVSSFLHTMLVYIVDGLPLVRKTPVLDANHLGGP